MRWWNVLHPSRYASALRDGTSPAAGHERLTAEQRRTERVMLGIRVAEGLALSERAPVAARLADSGLLEPAALERGIALLTLDGRLLADRVAVTLLSPPVSALDEPG